MKDATIFSIEEFAVHDGPGIRTTLFFKGCPLHCVWCHNPEGISPDPEYMTNKKGKILSGKRISSGELAKLVVKNQSIYEMNNGGITLTGGEPLYQASFLMEFLPMIKPIHIVIETSGYASPSVFEQVTDLTDLVLLDVKHMDSRVHQQYTGVGNEPVLKNLQHLGESGKPFVVRIPLIPGVNDTEENMENVLQAISCYPSLQRVELLRYHKTAGAKYGMLGKVYNPPFNTELPPAIHNVFEKLNIQTMIL